MKTNFKLALMAFAAVLFASCNPAQKPDNPGNNGDDDEPTFVSKVDVTDNSIAEWDNLPAEYVATAVCAPNCSKWQGLTSVKVYADQMYLNVLVEFNEDIIVDKAWVPLHMYIDMDNSPLTGGYADEFNPGDADILLEGGVFAEGNPNSFNPAVFKWWGNVGEAGWLWTDPSFDHDDADFWGALIGEGQSMVGASQVIGNKIEIQVLREMIPEFSFAETFGIGFDIQQNWTSVGVLPNADDDEAGNAVLADKLRVTIDMAD